MRAEDARLVRGQGRFIDNVSLPGMAHLALVRSPVPHARVRTVDVGPALSRPGVVAAFSGADLAGVLPALPVSVVLPGTAVVQHHPLAIDRVTAAGQAVAAVVAEGRAAALDAADAVEVEYDPLPAVADPHEALMPDAPLVHPELGSNLAYALHLGPPAGLDGSDVVVTERLVNQRLAPSPMETRGVVADYRDADGTLTLYLTTQGPHLIRSRLSELLGVPEARVRVVAGDVGGAFGSKYAVYPEDLIAAALSRQLGRPIKWIEGRSESLTATTHGRGVTADVRLGAGRDGRVNALYVQWVADAGAHLTLFPSSALLACSMLSGPYRIPQISFDVRVAYTNKAPVDPYRGFYRAEATYVLERMMDALARRLELDPVEVRRRNLISPDELPYTTATAEVYDTGDYGAALDAALRLVDYEGTRRRQAEERERGRYLGIGVSTYVWRAGFPSSPHTTPDNDFLPGGWEAASVRVERTGAVTVRTGASPHGQGLGTTLRTVVHEVLGVAADDVEVVTGDTAAAPFGMGSAGSRSMAVAGSAVRMAADEVRRQATELAAHLLEAAADDLEWEGREVAVRGVPSRRLALAELGRRAALADRPPGMEPGLEARAVFEPEGFNYPYGTHACVVEVDPETGAVRVLDYVAVDDCGRAVSPTIVEGQIHGSTAQGVAQALLEEAAYDSGAQPLATSFLTYCLPSAAELPSFRVARTEVPTDRNPLGAKGIGEAGTIGAPPTVVNAVLDALAPLGVVHLDMPVSPERIWRAVAGAGDGV
jgi:aerobic carbon-monoxide dehydrogenase large subunit